jgi:hypothetical protein
MKVSPFRAFLDTIEARHQEPAHQAPLPRLRKPRLLPAGKARLAKRAAPPQVKFSDYAQEVS